MTHRQHNHPVATHLPGGLSVYVARWPQRPGHHDQPKPPQVAWRDGSTFRYLPPEGAREFAKALLQAAGEIDGESE